MFWPQRPQRSQSGIFEFSSFFAVKIVNSSRKYRKDDLFKMTEVEAKELCDRIRQIAYELHVHLWVGYLEKVYENGLKHRLEKAGYHIQTQFPIQVRDVDGFILGDYSADMIVDGLMIELKSVSMLTQSHVAQIINYLKATNQEHGLLINFGSEKFQCRKIIRSISFRENQD